ncbi:SapC family protein [uncultured Halovibrio sp.]|uniref:SapC family protein n=1 Tax=uncultured Halovibrio sp. TaxID=985049 RepID=UPI0025E1630A|nr:SapC family protein [uncultured Halovibrio sp.]
MSVTVLDPERHGSLRLLQSTDFSFARDRIMVPVWGQEIPHAARFFPVVFMPRDDQWIPIALMGLEEGRNPFVSSRGKWLADYIPAVLRAHPFYSVESGQGEPVLGIEENDPSLTEDMTLEERSLPLFEADGTPSELTHTALSVLQQIRGQQEHTWKAMRILERLDLLAPWVPRSGERGSSQLYAVDETAIKNLDDERFLELREPGVLALIYAHLVSLRQFHSLQKSHSQLWLAAKQQGSNALFPQESDLFIFGDR